MTIDRSDSKLVIDAKIGEGGMGVVFRAWRFWSPGDPRGSGGPKLVALKALRAHRAADPRLREYFRREAEALRVLSHPNIVQFDELFEHGNASVLAMEFVDGEPLDSIIKRHKARATPHSIPCMPALRAVAYFEQLLGALAALHAMGIVHRDVKPQNVLLDEAARVYLADFGIAKILESSGGLTASGMITGTPQYMAPEQATGLKIGPAADVYALGIMAYEMLTGRVPFSADTPVAVLMKHVQEPLPLPGPDVVPEAMLRALLKAAAKKPEERWPSAGAFVDALGAGVGAPGATPTWADVPTLEVPRTLPAPEAAPTVVSPVTRPAPPPLPSRAAPLLSSPQAARRKAGLAPIVLGLGALGLLGVVAIVGAWLWLGRREPAASPEAPSVADAGGHGPASPPAVAAASPPRDSAAREPRPTAEQVPAPPATARPVAAPSPTPRAATTPRPQPQPAFTPAATPAPTPVPPAATAVDPEVQRLASALTSSDTNARRQAAQELAGHGLQAGPAVPALAIALGDRSPDVRLRAAEALGRIGPAASPSVPSLAQSLHDSDTLVAAEAAKALGLLGEAAGGAAAALGSALAHPAVGVRREAARALGKLGARAEPALSALVSALSDRDKTVCAQAARALGHLGAAARPALPRLTALSKDADIVVSREAQGALEAIGRNAP
jgi:serine/threonine-protein kinase